MLYLAKPHDQIRFHFYIKPISLAIYLPLYLVYLFYTLVSFTCCKKNFLMPMDSLYYNNDDLNWSKISYFSKFYSFKKIIGDINQRLSQYGNLFLIYSIIFVVSCGAYTTYLLHRLCDFRNIKQFKSFFKYWFLSTWATMICLVVFKNKNYIGSSDVLSSNYLASIVLSMVFILPAVLYVINRLRKRVYVVILTFLAKLVLILLVFLSSVLELQLDYFILVILLLVLISFFYSSLVFLMKAYIENTSDEMNSLGTKEIDQTNCQISLSSQMSPV